MVQTCSNLVCFNAVIPGICRVDLLWTRQVSQRVEAAALARKQLKGPLEFRVPWPFGGLARVDPQKACRFLKGPRVKWDSKDGSSAIFSLGALKKKSYVAFELLCAINIAVISLVLPCVSL